MFEAKTNNIRVQVEPSYVLDESRPQQDYFFFSYKVRISNEGDQPTQLLARRWIIKDAYGKTEEVRGSGVVGMQPKLQPGESFEYSSFCPLSTPTGSMQGHYLMVNGNGDQFEVEIPLFLLSEPGHYH